MPLEIRELIIKVNIEESAYRNRDADIRQLLNELKEEVIEQCTEQVIRKIEKSMER